MEIKKDAYYKIVNRNSGLVADVAGKSKGNSAHLEQLDWHGEPFQQWLLYPLDGGRYAIINRNSGLVADVAGKSTSNSARLEQLDWHGEPFQQWLLYQTNDQGYYKIVNQNSGLVADVAGKSKGNSAHLEQLDDQNESFQYWSFDEVESITLPSVETKPLPIAPQYKSLNDYLPDSTEPVVTAYTLLPCIMVNDNNWSADKKMQHSPYYMLTKTQYWKKIDSHTFAPHAQYTSETKYGMSQTDQESMTRNTNISVKADAGFSFKAVSIGISKSVTKELQVSKSTTTTQMTEQTNSETIANPNNYTVAWTKYALVTEYTLKRGDGIRVSDPWTVINKNDERESYWPLDAPLNKAQI
ncbi:RICIN domain-containing protein [Brevibacillus laterosporus]|uniref:RICIN domain-containing protein n=1 Tax=Brevibacillus laterosporus TaxID=1465 RepID=UPI00144421D4|nr:RICIN domain-containing protein [Brevibacillus laterosporus]NKQ20509.1 hypothetical protein [Brevibacillus laterosporus]WNX32591.1 RICIN domain-containing protein [Brevibacillus laterosporus]